MGDAIAILTLLAFAAVIGVEWWHTRPERAEHRADNESIAAWQRRREMTRGGYLSSKPASELRQPPTGPAPGSRGSLR